MLTRLRYSIKLPAGFSQAQGASRARILPICSCISKPGCAAGGPPDSGFLLELMLTKLRYSIFGLLGLQGQLAAS